MQLIKMLKNKVNLLNHIAYKVNNFDDTCNYFRNLGYGFLIKPQKHLIHDIDLLFIWATINSSTNFRIEIKKIVKWSTSVIKFLINSELFLL